jgi:hypothetical protein
VVVIGCGRLGFDPAGDGNAGLGDAASVLPPAGNSCASAATLVLPTSGTDSIASATANLSSGNCTTAPQVGYVMPIATAGNRTVTILATFDGVLMLTQFCPATSNGNTCENFSTNQTKIATRSLPVGSTYLFVSSTSGTGTTFQLSVK